MAEEAASGQGLVRFWAFTPALDLLKLHKEAAEERGEQKGTEAATNNPFEGPVTVLLLGLADVHHILWTAQARNTEGGEAAEVHFILAEELPEAAARALLLLHILTDDSLSVRDRVALYIDVYANAFVKEQTALYVHRASLRLEDFVCGEAHPTLGDLVNLSLTKNRNRDELLRVLRGWRRSAPFEAEKLREQRLRHFYGDRFDYRANLMDWNYQTHIQPYARLVHWRQYKRFAMTGQAFDSGAAAGLEPNRTLAAYVKGKDKKEGTSVMVRGFWADVVSGPFFTHGVAVEAPFADFVFRVVGQQQRHNAHEVFEFNLTCAMFRLVYKKELTLPSVAAANDTYPYPTLVEQALGTTERRNGAKEADEASEQSSSSSNSSSKSSSSSSSESKVEESPAFESSEDGGSSGCSESCTSKQKDSHGSSDHSGSSISSSSSNSSNSNGNPKAEKETVSGDSTKDGIASASEDGSSSSSSSSSNNSSSGNGSNSVHKVEEEAASRRSDADDKPSASCSDSNSSSSSSSSGSSSSACIDDDDGFEVSETNTKLLRDSHINLRKIRVSLALRPLNELFNVSKLKGKADICVMSWSSAGRLLLDLSASPETSGRASLSQEGAPLSKEGEPSSQAHHSKAAEACALQQLLGPNAVVVVESLKFAAHITGKSKLKFRRLVAAAAEKRGWRQLARNGSEGAAAKGDKTEAEEVTEHKAQEEEQRAPPDLCFLT